MNIKHNLPHRDDAPTKRSEKVVAAERWLAAVRGLPGTKEQFERSVNQLLDQLDPEDPEAAQTVADLTCLMDGRERAVVTETLARCALERLGRNR